LDAAPICCGPRVQHGRVRIRGRSESVIESSGQHLRSKQLEADRQQTRVDNRDRVRGRRWHCYTTSAHIFKAKHTNDAWIPAQAPRDWRFSTSSSGWTSDSHGYEWLTRVFEPLTRPQDPTTRRLLIMDGHSSHVTANVIAFCIKNAIDLLILPPHTSHILQPLDVGVFAPLKRALAS